MLTRRVLLIVAAGIFTCLTANAQLFETRSTRYSGDSILASFNKVGTKIQLKIRDSVTSRQVARLGSNDVIETFYDDYHLGLVIYRYGNPFELLGFWDPEGKEIDGGTLTSGTGEVKTPFNPNLISNFRSESVHYVSGIKNGKVFYYCDCASVLRKGTFTNNEKSGLWKEFTPNGDFVKQKRIKVVEETIKFDKIKIDIREPAHCMMRNPDEDIKCPKG